MHQTDLDKQEDTGNRSNGMPYTNETRPSDETVHWHFKHALAKIIPTISSTLYTEPYSTTVTYSQTSQVTFRQNISLRVLPFQTLTNKLHFHYKIA